MLDKRQKLSNMEIDIKKEIRIIGKEINRKIIGHKNKGNYCTKKKVSNNIKRNQIIIVLNSQTCFVKN